jgi:iron complex transport system substrate-binding protein
MKKSFAIVLICCFGMSCLFPRTVTDMAGRRVEVPENIYRVFPYDSKTSIFIFPLVSEKMVATSVLPGKKNYKYISKSFTTLPGIDVKNIEEVLSVSPQLIIGGFYNKKDNTGTVLSLGKRLRIPVILIDLSIDHMDQSFIFLGKLFGREKESEQYISYLQTLYRRIDLFKKSNKPIAGSVYYTLGTSGLLTDPSGSKHTEVFDYLGIPNAVKVEIPSGGHAKVNLEQVIMWNPDFIFTSAFRGENNAYTIITTDSKWKSINAVKNHKVYIVPNQPMGWFDHPPSINRIPGLVWLCQVFYGQSETDTRIAICRFYKLFYKYELSTTEYKALFN